MNMYINNNMQQNNQGVDPSVEDCPSSIQVIMKEQEGMVTETPLSQNPSSQDPASKTLPADELPGEQLRWYQSRKAKAGIGLASGFLLVGIAAAISLPLTRQKYDCRTRDYCHGIDQKVLDYTLQKYTEQSKVQTMLSYAQTAFTLNQTDSNKGFRNLFQQGECVRYRFKQDYQKESLDMTNQLIEAGLINQLINVSLDSDQQVTRFHTDQELEYLCNTSIPKARRLQAQGDLQGCGFHKQTLYFISGVGYTPDKAIRNINAARTVLDKNPRTRFNSFNFIGPGRQQKSQLYSIIQVFFQKKAQSNENYSKLDQDRITLAILQDRTPEGLQKNLSSKDLTSIYYSWEKNTIFNSFLLAYELKQEILEGRKIVLVAHSQGSLFSNTAYLSLSAEQQSYISLLYLGPAASTMPGVQRYITNPNDLVINVLRWIYGCLKANSEAKTWGGVFGILNHNAVGYLNNYQTEFTNLVLGALASAKQPKGSVGNGHIAVELSWDLQPDWDLHVFEPDSTHVYYGKRNGTVGFLDIDHNQTYGFQHYYTLCSKMTSGTFRIGVNYFRGIGQSTALVRVSAGSQFAMKKVVLVSSSGIYGDSFPTIVFDVIVTRIGADNKFFFEIE